MHIAVISCRKYEDAWRPFWRILERFWPNHPDVYFLTERDSDKGTPDDWCSVLTRHAKYAWQELAEDPILVMQEDFFLTDTVKEDLVNEGLYWFGYWTAGAARLYPMPGADSTWDDPHWGFVRKNTRYRINCQATIYRPDYLYAIASNCGTTPSDFEIWGTEYADTLPDMVLAFNRESQPWPIDYLCSGITRGKWNPDAKPLFEANGIEMDWSVRGFHHE